jgi:hypothetical protein
MKKYTDLELKILDEIIWTYEFDTLSSFRLNPRISGIERSVEEEFETSLFIIQELSAWVELDHSGEWDETMVRIIGSPPPHLRAKFLRKWLEEAYARDNILRGELLRIADM